MIAVEEEDGYFYEVSFWGRKKKSFQILKCLVLANDVMPAISLLSFRPAAIFVFAFQYKHGLNNYS